MAIFQQSAQATRILIPVGREIPADLETPVSVYLKLAGQGPSFLRESVTGGEQVARYSFIGVGPGRAFVLRDGTLQCFESTGIPGVLYPTLAEDCRTLHVDDPLKALSQVMARYQYRAPAGLPRFAGD
jgi:anthranilate synthase component I